VQSAFSRNGVCYPRHIMNAPAASCLIEPDRLRARLGAAAQAFALEVLPACESTSTLLLARARGGAPSGSLLVADRQTAGRGRRGRQWLSSPAASLTFSLLWRFPGGLARLAGLSLAVGVALVQALEQYGIAGLGLKWPNDLLLDGGKLAGVLVELESGPREVLAVIGIGLNLQLPPTGEGEFLHPPAALAQVIEPLPERHDLLAQLLIALADVLGRFDAGGFAVLRDEWQARHAWQERPVRLLDELCAERAGICLGADRDGALLLRTETGVERCFSGDVSLRRA
ncbi:biotin--[acetyl-CoA-carboxylase] ligase, partial [Accumulibacter sp.]|uniref:biotin--[acetyl-CoA-carboxylase] ligase n=2 Tax=Accumulibacter sp. TaxID=2053492 RepID=UPI002D1FBA45